MISHARSVLIASMLLAVLVMRAEAQPCDGKTEQRLDQETYLALTDRVYVYAPDISSLGTSGGWKAFSLRVLAGTFRRPLLLPKAFLKENDLQTLMKGRRDIRQSMLAVPGYDPKSSSKGPSLAASVTVKDGEKGGTITVRVTRVVPVGKGTDHVFVACTSGR